VSKKSEREERLNSLGLRAASRRTCLLARGDVSLVVAHLKSVLTVERLLVSAVRLALVQGRLPARASRGLL